MPEDADQDILEPPHVCFSWFDMPENAGDEMQKRLTATLTSDFPDAPEELPGSTPSLGLGQKVSSGVSLGEDPTHVAGGSSIREVQVDLEVHPAGPFEDLAI